MKFNYNGTIVEAFRYGVDKHPEWYKEKRDIGIITSNGDSTCTVHSKVDALICETWDYLVYDYENVHIVNHEIFQQTAYPIYDKDDNMSEMNRYWANKSQRITQAYKHINKMEFDFHREIQASLRATKIYRDQEISDMYICNNTHDTRYILFLEDTVNTLYLTKHLFEHEVVDMYKIAVLNYASFKNPGGGFLQGSSAQEESLCHHSTLFNVISQFKGKFYIPNLKKLNNGLYTNDILYTPNIVFTKEHEELYHELSVVDVITCAAPNKAAIRKYNKNIDDETINNAMKERIDHVLYTAYLNKVDTLILGPFGCGVFGNDPKFVAETMKELLETKYRGVFKNVVFSLPIISKNTDNTLAFWKVFSE